MTSRPDRWRSVAIAVAALAMAVATSTNAALIAPTEADWTDDVYTGAQLKASEYAGVNYARAIGTYGTISRITTNMSMGPFTASRITGQTPPIQSNIEPHSSTGSLGFLPVSAQGSRCARSGNLTNDTCSPQEIAPSANSFAVAELTQFSVHASTSLFGNPLTPLVTYSNSSSPIAVTASCSPGEQGTTGIMGTGSFVLGSGSDSVAVAIPTAATPSTSGTRSVPLLYNYDLRLRYTRHAEKDHAWAQLAIRVETTSLLGGDRWAINAILARAECGNSRQMPSLPNRPNEGNPAILAGGNFSLLSDRESNQTSIEENLDELLDKGEGDALRTSMTPTAIPTAGLSPEQGQTSTSAPDHASHGAKPVTTETTPATKSTVAVMSTPPATKTATSTSAAPATVIPSAPGTLSTTAMTETVGTVEVDGDELDVVVKGDTVPADARTALTALDTWINEGARPSGDWRTFTSGEPDSDGWRWAAVNQATGTIVYVR